MRRTSLRSLFLILLVAALIVSNGVLTVRLFRFRREVEQLRRETGHLVVVDKGRVNLIAIPSHQQNVWRWRIYAPSGTRFDVGIKIGDIPRRGAAIDTEASFIGFTLPPSEGGTLVTLSASKSIKHGYAVAVRYSGGAAVHFTDKPPEEWLQGTGSSHTAGTHGLQLAEFDEPLILRRFAKDSTTSGIGPGQSSVPGYLVWLVPHKP